MSGKPNARVAVVGAGAAGLMAAALLNRAGLRTDLYEKNDRPGKKLGITGKGRCNITNDCTPDEFFRAVVRGDKFLRSVITRYPPAWLRGLVGRDLPLKTERGGRVFPVSDKAGDVVAWFSRAVSGGTVTLLHETVQSVSRTDGGFELKTGAGERRYDFVLLATGGKSYPGTGSTGDGYAFARALGHTVTPLSAALVGVECASDDCAAMQGLSLKNVVLTVRNPDGKVLYSDMGEALFTHFGLSGPLVLSASARVEHIEGCTASIDLKPALDEKALDARLLRDFSEEKNRAFKNSLSALLPLKLIPVAVARSGIPAFAQVNSITRAQRQKLVSLIKSFDLEITARRPLDEAVVTAGGVALREISPATLESRLCPNLYFAGEIIDAHAVTGGYNLQIAFSCAAAVAEDIIEKVKAGE